MKMYCLLSAFCPAATALNLRDLETALEVMQRPPSIEASLEIFPVGRQGGSVVSVDSRERDRYSSSLAPMRKPSWTVSSAFTWRWTIPSISMTSSSFASTDGEILETYQINSSEEISYTFALGAFLVRLSRSDIEFEQRIQGINDSFVSEGERCGSTIAVEGFAAGLELKDSRNFFEDHSAVATKPARGFAA